MHPTDTDSEMGTDRQNRGKSPSAQQTSHSASSNRDAIPKNKQQREHYVRVFESWQRVKESVRESETDRLNQRIALQRQLVETQQQRYEQRQEDLRQRQNKDRVREKSERAARNEALQQICRQSLEEDRRSTAERHRADFKNQANLTKAQHILPTKQTPHVLKDSPLAEEAHADSQVDSLPGTILPGVTLPSTTLPGATLPSATLPMVDENCRQEQFTPVLEEEEEGEPLPWHHIQLYQLYGNEADYFLHPKIQTEKKADIVLNPSLKAIGGRAGAGTLWNVLRNESKARLVRQDSKLLSQELKAAFGAFAREGLANQRTPVRRNFYSTEDVPDMEKLMDQSRVHRAQEFRHRVELMYRSSTINQDRTKVLLYNNPAPDLNNQEGKQSVQRYMPSWADTWDTESEMSYRKWLSSRVGSSEQREAVQGNKQQDNYKPTALSSTRRQSKAGQYRFLTEEEATVPGEFTQRHKQREDASHQPAAHSHMARAPLLKSCSAMAGLTSNRPDSPQSVESELRRGTHSQMSSQFISQWAPLSLNALMEYHDKQDAMGSGRFNQGKKPVWSTSSAPGVHT